MNNAYICTTVKGLTMWWDIPVQGNSFPGRCRARQAVGVRCGGAVPMGGWRDGLTRTAACDRLGLVSIYAISRFHPFLLYGFNLIPLSAAPAFMSLLALAATKNQSAMGATTTPTTRSSRICWARRQINYMLGANPFKNSFVVGYT